MSYLKRSSLLLMLIAGLVTANEASAQYPEEYPQAQPQPQPQPQQPAPVPVTNMVDQTPDPVIATDPSIARPGGFRLHIQGYLGGAGSATLFFEGEDLGSGDLAPTFGIQIQGLIPIGDFILVGPELSFRSAKGERADDRVSLFGAGAAFGGHFAIALNDSLAIDPYLLFNLGLGVATANDALASDEVEVGLSVGFRAGVNLWFSDALGVSFALGYQSAHLYPANRFGENAHLRIHELAIDLGVAFRFGE